MNKQIEHTYDVTLNWTEGRKGTLHSPVLDENIEVATPPEFEGGVEGVWSPEHLFTASVSSCFMTTFLAIAEYSGLSYEDLTVKATGKMEKVEGKFVMSEIILEPRLTIAKEKDTDKAMRIMEKAENACLITRSIKTSIVLEPQVMVGTPG